MHTKVNDFQWMIGGESGFGIKVTGQMFSRLCVRGGLNIFDYTEYPSLIRGGHNAFQVTVGEQPVFAPRFGVDLLVALNQETVDRHLAQLVHGGAILYDPDAKLAVQKESQQEHAVQFAVPLAKIAKQAGGTILMRNTVALGASVGLLKFDMRLLEAVMHTAFDRKGEETVAKNIEAARAGFAYVQHLYAEEFPFSLKAVQQTNRLVMNGNNAISIGAVSAGCKFYASYPMTPTSGILSYLAKHAQETGMVVRHAEDEISAINSAIGASYAGVRSMVGTAGGGFSLMVEAVGLAAMTETPLVIVEGQRPGPSTGLPTWTSQADLQFVLHAGQDDFPRVVLAPGDAQEAFYVTHQAFNVADQYQTPVFVLTDKFLSESHTSIAPFATEHVHIDRGALLQEVPARADGMFARYAPTPTGVSPRVFPGTPNGIFTANSDEHDVYGTVNDESANRILMMNKRMKKMETASLTMPLPTLYGPQNAKLTLVGWGSTKGPMLAAAQELQAKGKSVNVLHFVYLHPLPVERLLPMFRRLTCALMIENNATGQFAAHLKQTIGFVAEGSLSKYDGRPFFPHEIVNKALALV